MISICIVCIGCQLLVVSTHYEKWVAVAHLLERATDNKKVGLVCATWWCRFKTLPFSFTPLCQSSIRYTKGRWFLLSGVYDRESNISRTGGGG